MATIENTNRGTENILLPPDVSNEIWAKTQEASAVMQLARRVALPGQGEEFQTITGDVTPEWVSETGVKPVDNPTFGKRSWKGYKMAVILPFSNEFRRDKARLYDEIVNRVPATLGQKFDRTCFGFDETPGELFDTFKDVEKIDIQTGPWAGLVAADAYVSEGDGILDGWALAPKAKSILLNAKDGMERPLFIDSMTTQNTVGTLMGSPTYFRKGVYKAGDGDNAAVLGFAGDWNACRYGVVEDINMKISEEAVIHTDSGDIYLWQQNMFAVLFEFTAGFLIQWPEQFVKLTGDDASKTLAAAATVKVAAKK